MFRLSLKMKNKYMIQDYPELIKYFASMNPLHLFFYVIPMIFGLNYLMMTFDLEFSVICFGLGVIYWSFLEYAIHRFLYHVTFKNKIFQYFIGSFHLYHHSDMGDHRVLNAGLLMVGVVTPIVLSPFLLIFSLGQVLSMAYGLIFFYYCYECVHYLIHYREYKTGYMAYIQKYHMLHHTHAPLKNFGNTSHIWDIVFRTYDARYKNYELSEKSLSTMITAKKQRPANLVEVPVC
jgi:4-hydroxysphinganine ceramide fatty acyl 2-hydroxylase